MIEAFPDYHDVPQPPKKPTKVVDSRVIPSPTVVGIGVAGIAVILLVAVITVLLTHRRGPNPSPTAAQPVPSATPPSSPPPPPTLTTPEQLEGILLSAADINAVMGKSTMQVMLRSERMDTGSATLSNPDCQGAFFPARDVVYAGSGQTAARIQVLYEPGSPRGHYVVQAAVTFPSADQASRFVQNSAGKWKNCANQTVTITTHAQTVRWAFASLNGTPPAITLNEIDVEDSNNRGCQRALSAVSNVVIDVDACDHVTNEGGRIADKMVAKVKGQ